MKIKESKLGQKIKVNNKVGTIIGISHIGEYLIGFEESNGTEWSTSKLKNDAFNSTLYNKSIDELKHIYAYGWWIDPNAMNDFELVEEPKSWLTLRSIKCGLKVKTKSHGGTVVARDGSSVLLAFNDTSENNGYGWPTNDSGMNSAWTRYESPYSLETIKSNFAHGWWVSSEEIVESIISADAIKAVIEDQNKKVIKTCQIKDAKIGSVVNINGGTATILGKTSVGEYIVGYKSLSGKEKVLPWETSELYQSTFDGYDTFILKSREEFQASFTHASYEPSKTMIEVIEEPKEEEGQRNNPIQLRATKLGDKVKFSKYYGEGTVVAKKGDLVLIGYKDNVSNKSAWTVTALKNEEIKKLDLSLFNNEKEYAANCQYLYWITQDSVAYVEENNINENVEKLDALSAYDVGSVVNFNGFDGEYTIIGKHESGDVLIGLNHNGKYPKQWENLSQVFYESTSILLDNTEQLKKSFKKTLWMQGQEPAKLVSSPSKLEVKDNGDKVWTNDNGQYHRISGPALELRDGTKIWYRNGIQHRDRDPAVERPDGSKEWWVNGVWHREDGPAYEPKSGNSQWWYNGKRVDCKTQEEFEKWKSKNVIPKIEPLPITIKFDIDKITLEPTILQFDGNEWQIVSSSYVKRTQPKEEDSKSTIKNEFNKAVYRVAGTQITKGVKSVILAAMEKAGHNSAKINTLADMLDTEYGTAIVSVLIGHALTHTDLYSDDRIKKIADEFRIGGFTTAGNAIFSQVIDTIMPVITESLSGIEKEQIRIEVPNEHAPEVEDQKIRENSIQSI